MVLFSRPLKKCLVVFGTTTCVLLWFWSLLAIWFWPHCPAWLSCSLAATFVVFTSFWFARVRSHWKWSGLALAFVLLRVVWEFNQPSNDRAWVDYNAQMPVSVFIGDRVTLNNFRVARWRSPTQCDLRWEKRTYDLNHLASVEFIISPFALNGSLAHTFLTFGFDDGEHLAVSVEIRKEQGESFSPIRGIFRHYETIYIVGDENDLIALRTLINNDPVYIFPVRATRVEVRSLFELLLRDANQLALQPQWYNSLVNSCHLRIVRHVNTLRKNKIGIDWRNYLPGRSDELAWELGLIDFNGSFEGARQRFLIKDRVPWNPDSKQWSSQIRRSFSR